MTVSIFLFIKSLYLRICFEFSSKWIGFSTGIREKSPYCLKLVSLGINRTLRDLKFSLP